MDPIEQLVLEIRSSIADQSFQKITLGKFRQDEEDLEHVYVRLVDLKSGPRLSFIYRYPDRDVTKNSPMNEGISAIAGWLGSNCRAATLFTTRNRQQLVFNRRGEPRLFVQESDSPAAERSHDRSKVRLLRDEHALHLLGVIDPAGRPRAQMGDKYRQVHRFIEALAPMLKTTRSGEALHIVDMGCGKGYLTFALHEFLRAHDRCPITLGIERRGALVQQANNIARQLGDPDIKFIEGEIGEINPESVDVLIALHACDTATDDAIYQGIKQRARWIVVSPCCQHELRPQIKAPAGLEPLFKHGIQIDRMTESVTDTLRCLYLEGCGYRPRILEFVGAEHTAKNLLIVASRSEKPLELPSFDRALDFQRRFGITSQRLAALLDS
jgi:SAM-dependent methyltransferase